jgi:hypothetical protein
LHVPDGGHDLDVLICGEQLADALPHDQAVLGEDDSNRH